MGAAWIWISVLFLRLPFCCANAQIFLIHFSLLSLTHLSSSLSLLISLVRIKTSCLFKSNISPVLSSHLRLPLLYLILFFQNESFSTVACVRLHATGCSICDCSHNVVWKCHHASTIKFVLVHNGVVTPICNVN